MCHMMIKNVLYDVARESRGIKNGNQDLQVPRRETCLKVASFQKGQFVVYWWLSCIQAMIKLVIMHHVQDVNRI